MLALLTDEQVMIRDLASQVASATGLVNPRDLESLDRVSAWNSIVGAGLLGLRERDSGKPAATGVEVMLAVEALAGRLVPLPFLGSGVLAVELLALAGAPRDLVTSAAAGQTRYAVLLSDDLSRLCAVGDGSAIAWDCADAEWLLALGGDVGARRLVRFPADGLEQLNGVDLTRVTARLRVVDGGEPIGNLLTASDLERWLALALTAVSADMVGAMRGALGGAVQYTKERVAFGVFIGTFQAVQHMCAEALVKVEGAASATKYAAWAVDEIPPGQALLAARTAKAYAASVAMDVPETVMQVYGGIGQTWEHIAHFYLRRTLLDRHVLGDLGAQLDAIAECRLERD